MGMIFLAAAAFEIASLKRRLPAQAAAQAEFIYVGIGPLAAAKTAALMQGRWRGKDIMFLGSCGVFGPFTEPTIYRCDEVHWLPVDLRLQAAYLVSGSFPSHDIKQHAHPSLSALPGCACVCSSTIALVDHAPPLETALTKVENLELYSCLPEVLQGARSFQALLVSTNTVGAQAHEQWKTHHDRAYDFLAQYVVEQHGDLLRHD